jgi:hypothetical protein
MICAPTLKGMRIPMIIEVAIDGEVMGLYVKHLLVPLPRPWDIVLWDQTPMHEHSPVNEMI